MLRGTFFELSKVVESMHARAERPGALGATSARLYAALTVWWVAVFLLNAVLSFGWDWPGAGAALASASGDTEPVPAGAWLQLALYPSSAVALLIWVLRTPGRTLGQEAAFYGALAAFVVRAAFWSVFLVGLADAFISWLRVEDLLPALVGKEMTIKLGLSKFRGLYVHYPLMALSVVIAAFTRSVSVVWLAFLVVLAEFQIVIARFVFSYEQALMGDLVRFWYAALFLIASAYTLVEDGHVRVDVFYARFSEHAKAKANILGTILLGLPLCWVILWMGLETKASSLASPLVTFEISQSGFGMYVKYLMAGCLVVFALSMNAQFASYLLTNVAALGAEPKEV